MRKLGVMLAATAALSFAAPANAVVVNYSFSSGGAGTMALDLTGGTYSLSALSLTLGATTFTQANSQMQLYSSPTYLLGSTGCFGLGSACSGQDSFFLLFNPASASQSVDVDWSNVGNTFHENSITITQVAGSVPEPASWAMMLVGFAGIGAALRRKKAGSAPTSWHRPRSC